MNEQLVRDLEYLQRGTRADGVEVIDVTADEAIKSAEAQQSTKNGAAQLIMLGRSAEIER